MNKIFNFINPSDEIINRINIYSYTSNVPYTYLISDIPHASADIMFISTSFLLSIKDYPEFQYIPFMVYGNVELLEKSFILGSYDFLREPWNFNELEIRALRILKTDFLQFKWGKIHFTNQYIKTDNHSLSFSVYEYKILSMLANNMDKTITRANLHYRLGIRNENSRVIDVYINSIRKKISLLINNNEKQIIRTIRGEGYTINSHYSCG